MVPSHALRALILSAALCLACASKEYVLTLTSDNFDEEIKNNDFIVVEFYAPWCGHCKKLAPEYESAAKSLDSEGSSIKLAKVDADEKKNKPLAERYGVRGFPTIKIIKGGGKSVTEYEGPRDAAGIVDYVKKMSGPAVLELKSADELKDAIASKTLVLVGVFSSLDSKEAEQFDSAADQLRADVTAFKTTDAALLPADIGSPVTAPAIRLFKNFDETFNDFAGEIKDDDVVEFVQKHSMPILVEMSKKASNPKALQKVFESDNPKVLMFIDYEDKEMKETYTAEFTKVASENAGDIHFVIGDSEENEHALRFFNLEQDDVPFVAIMEAVQDKKYIEKNIPVEKIAPFIKEFKDGNLKPAVKSQPIPEKNDEPVKVVVHDNFEDIVLSGKNVLLEFYAPWCGHCKSLAPIYEEIGKEFESDDSVVIAKIDATENDYPKDKFKVDGFPTLFFVKADSTIVPYSGSRSKEDLISFVKKNQVVVKSATDGTNDGSKSEL